MKKSTLVTKILRLLDEYNFEKIQDNPDIKSGIESGFELETKLEINNIEEVKTIVDYLIKRSDIILGCTHRNEHHSIYPCTRGHISTIRIAGLDEVWFKKKSDNQIILSESLQIPFAKRRGYKLRPLDTGYQEMVTSMMDKEPVFGFNKVCFNIFFSYQEHIYSLSFSLAWNENGFHRADMEFEYEGTNIEKMFIPEGKAVELTEGMLQQIIPDKVTMLHAQTKYEIISRDYL